MISGFRKLLIIVALAVAHFALQVVLLFANASVKMALFESPVRNAVLEPMNRRVDILLNVFGFPMFQLANLVPSHGIPYLDWCWFALNSLLWACVVYAVLAFVWKSLKRTVEGMSMSS